MILDQLCEGVLSGCLSQLDVQPPMVYDVCELLNTYAARNGHVRTLIQKTGIPSLRRMFSLRTMVSLKSAFVDKNFLAEENALPVENVLAGENALAEENLVGSMRSLGYIDFLRRVFHCQIREKASGNISKMLIVAELKKSLHGRPVLEKSTPEQIHRRFKHKGRNRKIKFKL